jgi:hypothetical protein
MHPVLSDSDGFRIVLHFLAGTRPREIPDLDPVRHINKNCYLILDLLKD